MRARRNSPTVDASRIPRMPPPPRQAEMGGMETDAAAVLLTGVQRKKEGKQSRNKVAEDTFDFQCRSYGLPPFVRQWELLKTKQTPRKDGKNIPNVWRFDFCFVDFKLIVEVDGGIWMPQGGAHSHPVDIERNILKRNDAVLAEFYVISFTPNQIMREERHAIAFTLRVLCERGWQQ
jgi:hypothetical protein